MHILTFRIQNLINPPPDYFRYFPIQTEFGLWGVGVTAAGYTRVGAGAPYPPAEHPADHDLVWREGRVLEAWQIVLIEEGEGVFESRSAGRKPVVPGSAFMLFPGEWHRYRPKPRSGWVENWIEVRGPVMARLQRTGVISPATPLHRNALLSDLDEALQAVHQRIARRRPGFDAELCGLALRVVAAWTEIREAPARSAPLGQAIARAEVWMGEHLAEAFRLEDLARDLGVSYSSFRRSFRQHTGRSPWQFMLQLRLARARRLLLGSSDSLESIAAQVGFSSAFHLSAAFKRAFGAAPGAWREKMRQAADPKAALPH